MLIACFSYVILNFVDLIIIIALTLLMRIVMSFVWRKFSSVGREEWCNKMKDGQKLKLGDSPVVTPRNIQEVQASKLGDARGTPSSSTKKAPGHFSMRYIFIASCIMCYSWSVFIFCCVLCFPIKLDPIILLFWRETRSTCSALGFSCLLFLRVVSNKLIGVGSRESSSCVLWCKRKLAWIVA